LFLVVAVCGVVLIENAVWSARENSRRGDLPISDRSRVNAELPRARFAQEVSRNA
jgi:hypothetical protein